jgi:hypothetical protein
MFTKNKYRNIVSMLFGLLILFTSIDISIDIHYCQGEIESVAFFGKKASCKMMAKKNAITTPCKFHNIKENNSEKNCCNNKKLVFKKIKNLSSSFVKDFKINLDENYHPSQVIQNKLVYDLLNIYIQERRPPPLIKLDFQVDFQSFLI